MIDLINAIVVLLNYIFIPALSYGSQLALGALGVSFIYAIFWKISRLIKLSSSKVKTRSSAK